MEAMSSTTTTKTHFYFCLNREQFSKLVSFCSDPIEFADLFYDDDKNSLLYKGYWLRKRCETTVLHKIINTEENGCTYECIPEHQISETLGLDWKQKYENLLLLQDVNRYYLDEETNTYIEQVHMSMDEYYLVGVSSFPIDQVSSLIKSKTGVEIDRRLARSKSIEWIYGFEEIKVYDNLVTKGFVKGANYLCSRTFNRPNVSISGTPDKKLSFTQVQKLWYLLEDE